MFNSGIYVGRGGSGGGGGGIANVTGTFPIIVTGTTTKNVAVTLLIDTTLAALKVLLDTNTAVPGEKYQITDTACAAIAMQVEVQRDSLGNLYVSNRAVAGEFMPDYQMIGDYSGVAGYTLYYGIDPNGGVWRAAKEAVLVNGNVIIWNGLHFVVVDATLFNGTTPYPNPAYAIVNVALDGGYIEEWDNALYEFMDSAGNIVDWMSKREDKRGNSVAYSANLFGITSINPFTHFQWGNDNMIECVSDSGGIIFNLNNIEGVLIDLIKATTGSLIDLFMNDAPVHLISTKNNATTEFTYNQGVVTYLDNDGGDVDLNSNAGSVVNTSCVFGAIDGSSNSGNLSRVSVNSGSVLTATANACKVDGILMELNATMDISATTGDGVINNILVRQASTFTATFNAGTLQSITVSEDSDIEATSNAGTVRDVFISTNSYLDVSLNTYRVLTCRIDTTGFIDLSQNSGTVRRISVSTNAELDAATNTGIIVNSAFDTESTVDASLNDGEIKGCTVSNGWAEAISRDTGHVLYYCRMSGFESSFPIPSNYDFNSDVLEKLNSTFVIDLPVDGGGNIDINVGGIDRRFAGYMLCTSANAAETIDQFINMQQYHYVTFLSGAGLDITYNSLARGVASTWDIALEGNISITCIGDDDIPDLLQLVNEGANQINRQISAS